MKTFTFNGKTYVAKGAFGAICLYQGKQCLAFNVMTMNDAENLAWQYSREA
ncbi:MAG TPA: hypothetical protein VK629_05680 [Steroidobacteraceae bacterium]|nr:hypothetical protein [Steroidobacteraceae bacterium]